MTVAIFDSAWRVTCRIMPCSVADVKPFIEAHYLHKRPAIVTLCLLALRGETPIGAAIFAAPPRETEKRYGGKTWELARLYLLDSVPKNAETWLIARSVKYIRAHHPTVRFLVSYADPSAGHEGTIYRAANWRFDGQTDHGRRTPRCDYVDAQTGKKYGRRKHVPNGAELVRVPRVSKHRFVMALKSPGINHWPAPKTRQVTFTESAE